MNKKEFWQAVYIAAIQAGNKYPHFTADEAVDALDNRIERGLLSNTVERPHPRLKFDPRGPGDSSPVGGGLEQC